MEIEKIIEDKESDQEMVQLAKKELIDLQEKNKINEKLIIEKSNPKVGDTKVIKI